MYSIVTLPYSTMCSH